MTDSKKVFIDTNIWIYAFLSKKTNNEKNEIILKLLETEIKQNPLVTSIQCINEFHNVLSRKYGIKDEEISQYINGICEISDVLPLNMNVYWRALDLIKKFKFSFWDSLIASIAILNDVDIIYSEDFQNNLNIEKSLKILNPFKN
ncbi:MAG: PIN domain-containing protein [bacterium]